MERAVNVRVPMCREKIERWRRGLELEERAEWRLAGAWRSVIVAVDDVSFVGLALNLPHRVHVPDAVGGTRVLNQRQCMPQGVVAANSRQSSGRRQSDLAAVLSISTKQNDGR